MARGMNHIYLIGVLARDPELRYTPSGVAVYEATIAGEDHLAGADGKQRQLPWYHRVSILGKPAEWQSERNLVAGDAVLVEGTLDYSSWDAPEGGKRSMVKVKALRMEQLSTQPETTQDAGGGVRMNGGMNQVMVVGNLTRDPDLRYTPAGDAVLGLSLAVNETWKDRQGQPQEKVHWLDVTLWRDLAEAAKDFHKGDPVLVAGRLTNESWTDKDGNKRNTTKIEANRFEVLSRGTPSGTSPTAAPAAQREPVAAAAPGARPTSNRAARPAPSKPARSGGLDIDEGLQDFPPEEDLPF
ncbi:single-stranded DNA-binding protein [Deinococcus ruber]|uniref:Single-stranded DNA-binding protein n=1 Tax=Deinococcus ruber TaxID=1848197 RepID=A0A918F8F5_9DEIO|nr:single-stranded DNA-binding protein [Deinococcus ruber]GGR15381.1 single-stranded DNA-binding protein [Deinococcus ruber]